MTKRCRRGDAHTVEIVDADALILERRRVAEDRPGQRRRAQRLLQMPGREQAERDGIASAPRPLVFAMVVIRYAFVFFVPEMTFASEILKETLIWVSAVVQIGRASCRERVLRLV